MNVSKSFSERLFCHEAMLHCGHVQCAAREKRRVHEENMQATTDLLHNLQRVDTRVLTHHGDDVIIEGNKGLGCSWSSDVGVTGNESAAKDRSSSVW